LPQISGRSAHHRRSAARYPEGYEINKRTIKIDKSATGTDKAVTNSDVPDSEKYSKEKFYYRIYFIKKKDKT
jgi:hypothetical protein